jgi:hypothetical protein
MKPKQQQQIPTKEIARIAKQVYMRNSEQKHFFVNSGSSALTFTSACVLFPLSQIAQGNSDATRVGDEINCERLRVSARLLGGTNSTMIRMIIFVWKPLASSTVPDTQLLIYNTISQDYLPVLSAIDPKVVPSQARILFDKTYGTVANVYNSPVCPLVDLNLKGLHQQFTGTTYSTNALYMLLYYQATASTGTYVYDSALTYRDS